MNLEDCLICRCAQIGQNMAHSGTGIRSMLIMFICLNYNLITKLVGRAPLWGACCVWLEFAALLRGGRERKKKNDAK